MKKLFVFIILIFLNFSLAANIFYTPSEYEDLYTKKYVLELELRHFRIQTKEDRDQLNSQINDLKLKNAQLESQLSQTEKKMANDASISRVTIEDRDARIAALSQQLEDLKKESAENKRLSQMQIAKLNSEINSLKESSNKKERNLISENESTKLKYQAEIDELKKQLSDERQNHIAQVEKLKNQYTREKDKQDRLIASLTEKLNRLNELNESQKRELDELSLQAKKLEADLEKEIKEGKLMIKRLKDRLIINMDNKILFASGSAVIKPEVKELLNKISGILTKYSDYNIRIEGHTDNVPIRNLQFQDNWQLSTSRSLAVLWHLLENAKINPSNYSAAGYGQFQPIVPNDSAANKSLNRRVDIVLTPKIKD